MLQTKGVFPSHCLSYLIINTVLSKGIVKFNSIMILQRTMASIYNKDWIILTISRELYIVPKLLFII